MFKRMTIIALLILSVGISCNAENSRTEISQEKAIKIASDSAKEHGFDPGNTDIEILKVKNGLEKGPIRAVTLFRLFPPEIVLKREFWVVYFYPKGQMEKATILGGDYTVLVDLHSGKIIELLVGQ